MSKNKKKNYLGKLAGHDVYVTKQKPEEPKKEYTLIDILKARNEERRKIFTIMNYILNKNSKPITEGGVDFEQVFEDMQDLETYLLDDIDE